MLITHHLTHAMQEFSQKELAAKSVSLNQLNEQNTSAVRESIVMQAALDQNSPAGCRPEVIVIARSAQLQRSSSSERTPAHRARKVTAATSRENLPKTLVAGIARTPS